MKTHALNSPYTALRLTYGLVPLLAGADKFTNLLTDWPKYLSPQLAGMLGSSTPLFMHVIGVVEMLVGLMVLTRWTKIGAFVATAWLTLIAVNLVMVGQFDVAVRDLAMAVGAFTLARMEQVREEEEGRVPMAAPRHGVPA